MQVHNSSSKLSRLAWGCTLCSETSRTELCGNKATTHYEFSQTKCLWIMCTARLKRQKKPTSSQHGHTIAIRLLRSHSKGPLEDVLIVDPWTVVHQKQHVHEATMASEVRADPVIGALLASQQDYSHMAKCVGLDQGLCVLQPLCGVGDLLLLTSI